MEFGQRLCTNTETFIIFGRGFFVLSWLLSPLLFYYLSLLWFVSNHILWEMIDSNYLRRNDFINRMVLQLNWAIRKTSARRLGQKLHHFHVTIMNIFFFNGISAAGEWMWNKWPIISMSQIFKVEFHRKLQSFRRLTVSWHGKITSTFSRTHRWGRVYQKSMAL